jgi:nickel-dependent lactate racemase
MYTIEEKELAIAYSDLEENTFLHLPKDRFAGFIAPIVSPKPSADFIEIAFDAPVHSPRLRDLAQGRKNAVILVSDATRQVPTAIVLPKILEEPEAASLTTENVSCIVATGVHRQATPMETRRILGKNSVRIGHFENHDPFDPTKLIDLGKTSFGTPVQVNKTVYEADLRIIVGKVEPHEFAGFSRRICFCRSKRGRASMKPWRSFFSIIEFRWTTPCCSPKFSNLEYESSSFPRIFPRKHS